MVQANPPYASFIEALPQADLPLQGVRGQILAAPQAQMVMFSLPAGTRVPPHSHAAQWGIVVEGELDFTIEGVTHRRTRGDSYHVPDGAVHSAVMISDCRLIEVFADPDRYRPKA